MADEDELIKLQLKISERCGVEARNDDVISIDGHNLHIPPMIFLKVHLFMFLFSISILCFYFILLVY